MDKDSWSPGYSMRFAVDESLRGGLGPEVTIETGNGGGDCGTPLDPGKKFLIFAYREKDGKLWTGMCSGNVPLTGDPRFDKILDQYRSLVTPGFASVFGRIRGVKPVWRGDDVQQSAPKPERGILVRANSGTFSASTKTQDDGSYEFSRLPNGKYTIEPEIPTSMDFDREYPDNYEADIRDGQCKNVSFVLLPRTRIRGHVTSQAPVDLSHIEIVALPTRIREVNQFSGQSDFPDEKGRFNLWPLPPGDYYVGVNINSSPSSDSPFPPTYYPGVTDRDAAAIVHLSEGDIKELDIRLPELAAKRTVHFTAIGLDGNPLRKIYVQLEDLRHPGDAASYVNIDLDEKGRGTMTVYAGYSYHLHGSHWVRYGEDWCAKPVIIPAGTAPIQTKFIMDHKDADCEIREIDHLHK